MWKQGCTIVDSLAPACLLRREPQLLLPRPPIRILPSCLGLPNDGSSFIMSATAGAASAPVRMPDLTRPKGALAPLTAVYSDDTWSNRVWNQVTLGFLEKSRQHMWRCRTINNSWDKLWQWARSREGDWK